MESKQGNVSEFKPAVVPSAGVMGTQVSSREVAEIQSAMTIAQARPRDEKAAVDRILTACGRKGLAECAVYQYSRGGTAITGPSIRLAEMLAREYGNITYGIRELEQRNGESTVEAFAWDLQTNTKQVKVFQVKHKRHTKKGGYALDDPRDIYELVANNGARRLRACLLGLIPGDIVDSAVEACAETVKASVKITPEFLKSLSEKFEKHGVTVEQLEARIQRRLSSITPGLVLQLGRIYTSIEDGMSVPVDWFPPIESKGDDGEEEKPKKAAEIAKEKLARERLAKLREENEKAVNGGQTAPEPDPLSPPDTDADGPERAAERISEADELARQEWIAAMPDLLLAKLPDDKQRKAVVTKYLGGNVETATLEQLRECAAKLEAL